MKKDKLEQFVIDNRDEFDELIPSPMLWDKIEKRESKIIQLNWRTIGLRVAAVVVIFISSYYFHDFVQNRNARQNVAASETGLDGQNNMYQELAEAEFYYTSQIEETREAVFYLTSSNHRLRDEINTEMLELDKVFRELKNDLHDNADNQEVIVAMIQNYRLKLEILKDILQQLKASKNEKNNNNEAKQISI
jgi:hypothetical protein